MQRVSRATTASRAFRWSNLEPGWGYPRQLTHEGLRAINQFADAERSVMVVSGRSAQSTSLPLTETHKAWQKGEKRAASAKAAAAAGGESGATPQHQQQPQPTAASTVIDGVRHSSTLNAWATPCASWAKGPCSRGINCWFRHDGIPTHTADNALIKVCVTCTVSYTHLTLPTILRV